MKFGTYIDVSKQNILTFFAEVIFCDWSCCLMKDGGLLVTYALLQVMQQQICWRPNLDWEQGGDILWLKRRTSENGPSSRPERWMQAQRKTYWPPCGHIPIYCYILYTREHTKHVKQLFLKHAKIIEKKKHQKNSNYK